VPRLRKSVPLYAVRKSTINPTVQIRAAEKPTDRPQKITFAELRDMGVRGILVYCADYRCSHSIAISGDRWADDVRLSDIEPGFICTACGKRGAKTSCTSAVLSAARCQSRYHSRALHVERATQSSAYPNSGHNSARDRV
jgi:hypothetical protein